MNQQQINDYVSEINLYGMTVDSLLDAAQRVISKTPTVSATESARTMTSSLEYHANIVATKEQANQLRNRASVLAAMYDVVDKDTALDFSF